jgi:hypothetical protein
LSAILTGLQEILCRLPRLVSLVLRIFQLGFPSFITAVTPDPSFAVDLASGQIYILKKEGV